MGLTCLFMLLKTITGPIAAQFLTNMMIINVLFITAGGLVDTLTRVLRV